MIFINALTQFLLMFFPVVYFREMKSGNHRTIRLYRGVMLALAALFVAVMVTGVKWLYLLTGARAYLPTVSIFVMIAFAALCDFIFDIYGLYFQYELKPWRQTWFKLFSLFIMLCGFVLCCFVFRADSIAAYALVTLVASGVGGLWGTAVVMKNESKSKKGFLI